MFVHVAGHGATWEVHQSREGPRSNRKFVLQEIEHAQ